MFGKRKYAADPVLGDLTLEERQLVTAHRREQVDEALAEDARRALLGDPDRPPQLTFRGEPLGAAIRPEMVDDGLWVFVPQRAGSADGVLLSGEVLPRSMNRVNFERGGLLRIARLS